MSLQRSWVGRAEFRLLLALSAILAIPTNLAYPATQARSQLTEPHRTHSAALGSGTCSWTDVPTPDTGSPHNAFNGVAALASNDVWAVGAYDLFGTEGPKQLIAHWNGMSWSQASTPLLGPGSELK